MAEERLPAVSENPGEESLLWPLPLPPPPSEILPKIREIFPPGKEKPGPLSPDVLQTILLDEITGRLEELGDLTKAMGQLVFKMETEMEKVPQGRMRPFAKSITGDAIDRWEVIDDIGFRCTSATVYNDGPNDVYVCLNEIRDGFQEIKEGESLDFDFHSPKIFRFFFKSTATGTANLRIPLEY